MRVLILRDKKPGHFHPAEGVAVSLATAVHVETTRIDVRPRWFAHSDVLKFCIRHLADRRQADLLRHLYGIDAATVGKPDIVVASGRPTIAAGILIARMTGARLVCYGRAKGYPEQDFAAMLVPFPRHDGDGRMVFCPVPSKVDPDTLPAPAPIASVEDLAGRTASLFVGGPSFSHTFSDAEWQGIVDLVAATRAQFGLRWNVSTSRRTPDVVVARFAALKQRGDVETFIDYRNAGPGSAMPLLAADAVVVTEDSLTMIAEGLAAMRRVVALKPRKVEISINDEMIAGLVGEGTVAVLPAAGLSPERFADRLLSIHPPVEDPRHRVARTVLEAVRGDGA